MEYALFVLFFIHIIRIERFSIVSLKENVEEWFVARVVFRKSVNKWHVSTAADDPSWPIGHLKGKNYRLIMSMVKINLVEYSVGYKIELKYYGILKMELMFVHLSSV